MICFFLGARARAGVIFCHRSTPHLSFEHSTRRTTAQHGVFSQTPLSSIEPAGANQFGEVVCWWQAPRDRRRHCRPSLRRKSARRGAGSVEPGTQVLEGSPAPQKERSCTTLPSGRTFCGACACRRSHRTLPAFSREVIQRRRHTVAEQAVTGRTEVVTRSARSIHRD